MEITRQREDVMKTIIYSYCKGKDSIPEDITSSVISVISGLNYSLRKYDIRHFKVDLSNQLKTLGWSDKVNLSVKSCISITAILQNVGL